METRNITANAIEELAEQQKAKKENLQEKQNSNGYDEKNYLNTKLDAEKGEVTREIRIRLLPIDGNSSTPFKKVHQHYVTVNKKINKSGFRNFVCLKHTKDDEIAQYGDKCPYCEIASQAWENYKKIKAEQELAKKNNDLFKVEECGIKMEEWRKIANENTSEEYVIVRCIERGHEDEGPKFWRFRLRSDGKDAMNTIIELYKTRRNESIEDEYGTDFLSKPKAEQEAQFERDNFTPTNILDVYNGKDLKVTISAVFSKDNKPTGKTSITITDYGKEKPITSDEEQLEKWITDEKRWWNVFPIKPYEYLDIASEGKVPYYDKEQGRWVENVELSNEADTKESAENAEDIKNAVIAAKQQETTSQNEDLPF